MLGRRVVTALVLLAILLPAIFVYPPLAWGVLTLVFLTVGAWEWGRLLEPPGASSMRAAVTVLVAGVALLVWRDSAAWPGGHVLIVPCAVLTLYWVVGGGLRLARHDARSGGWLLAAVVLLGCWLALYELRLRGPIALLSSMAIVWVAGIAAYFAGRAFGRRKLAPSISPGKSWEGAIGGFAAVALLGGFAAGAAGLETALPAVLASRLPLAAVLAVLVAIAALSIVGDLHESLLKRQAGVKDSGWILPGHGGVLDRIDALIPTMPAVLLIYELLR
ncbi:MAG: phosphatidate cytidylyltransferase [Burkholderiaceae bacterium]|nr:MAG: phosphatidate cytidylyltransferase [Burkholderiaceae bacterium]